MFVDDFPPFFPNSFSKMLKVSAFRYCPNTRAAKILSLLSSRCGDASETLSVRDFWQNFSQRERLVEEFSSSKKTRRLAHLSRAVTFLKQHNVVIHGILYPSPNANGWNTTREFSRVSAFGESILRNESCVRTLRMFPAIDDALLTHLVEGCSSQDSVASLYDALQLNALLDQATRRHAKPTAVHKQRMIFAMMGEMHWFALRTKATDRTHNNALFPPSDVLILHSLCAHAVETLVVELITSQFRDALEDLKLLWKNFHCSLPSQLLLKPRTVSRLSLSSRPRAFELHSSPPPPIVRVSPDSIPVVGAFVSRAPMPNLKKVGSQSKFSMRKYKDYREAMCLSSVSTPWVRQESQIPIERAEELLRQHV